MSTLALIDRDGCHGDYAKVYATYDSVEAARKAEAHERARKSTFQVARVPEGTTKGDMVHRNDIRDRGSL